MFKITVSQSLLGNLNEINGNIVFPHLFSHHATQFAQKKRIYEEKIPKIPYKSFKVFMCVLPLLFMGQKKLPCM